MNGCLSGPVREKWMSKELEKVRAFEKEKILKYDPAKRPAFHLTGLSGWINDPNGFSLFENRVHLFYQANPYDREPGQICWGHAVTEDFIKWTYLPCALAPSEEYDRDGCFSGSAITLPDGRHLLMYTGFRDRDGGEYRQVQCLAAGDGVRYLKYEMNPVLSSRDLPEGGSAADFRDPKIWEENGQYKALAANRAADGTGALLVYESADGFSWRFGGTLLANNGRYGSMWECPDLFSLDGTDILLFSTQMSAGTDPAFHPGFGTVCMHGRYEKKTSRFVPEGAEPVDYGTDFYAPQTLLLPDGRRVMIAWMQNWETSRVYREDLAFNGQMTIPREIVFRNGHLLQNPVKELEARRRGRTAYESIEIDGCRELAGISGRCIDLNVIIRPGESAEGTKRFFIDLAAAGNVQTTLEFDPVLSRLCVDRTRSGFPYDIVNQRSIPVRLTDGALTLRILLDRYSLEVFVNGGEQAASFVLYSPEDADRIRFRSIGRTVIDVEQFTVEGTVPEYRSGAE